MKNRYTVVILVLVLLLILSLGTSFVNYKISMNSTQRQLMTQSIPLSLDNIYTEIQKLVITPYLVSSTMAHDTFVIDWLKNDEESVVKIKNYLDSIKNKYSFLVAFLVSDKTKNYYTQEGLIEKIIKSRKRNQWYFNFKNSEKRSEINIDLNANIADNLIMFINFKILDEKFHYLGATGVGIKITYINKMLKMFKEKYKLKVAFFDNDGNFVLQSEDDKKSNIKNINDIPELKLVKDALFSSKPEVSEYTRNGHKYLISSKFIETINSYILVEAKLEDFTVETKKTFLTSFFISIALTIIIAIILIIIISKYNKMLEYLATIDELTKLPNRRSFREKFEYILNLSKRNQIDIFLIYIDIDNFKVVNDRYGHNVGDELLRKIANIITNNTRKTDITARLGGEEFVVVLVNISESDALKITNKIKDEVEGSVEINKLLNAKITISCGFTKVEDIDTIDSVLIRADKAMYEAKTTGKNRIVVK